MTKIFIDTGAFIAYYYKRDQNHFYSLSGWQKLSDSSFELITSNHVIDEFATLLGRKTNNAYASNKLELIYQSDMKIARTTLEDEIIALELFKKLADQKVSMTDCYSFIIMNKLSIKTAFIFDRHFHDAGFEILACEK